MQSESFKSDLIESCFMALWDSDDFSYNAEIIISSKCEALQHIEEIKSLPQVEMKDFNDDLKNKIRAFLEKHNKKASFDM